MSRKGLNIYKRKDGRWEARYIKSRNALGKPKYGYLYASSYREVRCDLQHTLQLQGKPSGSEERTRNSTFELVSMEWLDAFSINFKESTYIRYRTLIECYLIAIYDDQLEAYVEQAVLLYRQGKYQECIDAVETTQSRELKYYSRQSVANLYNVAAEAYYELESYESAATMYQKAIGYSPDILSYYQGEATALIQLGDYSGADEVLAEMAKAVPDAEQSGAYQVVQSELLRKQGDLPDALDAARKAIGSADGNDQLARAYRLAASICEDIGDSMLSEEINLLNQGIEQLPDGYYNALAGQLASAYIRQAEATGNPGYQKDALRTYQQLEKNGNTTLEVRLNIAMLQYQLHDFSKAMEMLQALKNDYPKDYRVYKWLAFVQGELDLQNGASYTKTLGYYETAAELYRAEQASGVYDPQMDELDRMARNNWQ